jgi:deoxyribodipyrimidine photo-lyase
MVSTKRKEPDAPSNTPSTAKKAKTDFSDRSRYKDSTDEIKYGIILRDFYPPELSDARANKYAKGEIERPIQTLEKAIKETQQDRNAIPVKDSVVHWFKSDTRSMDNKGLHLASEKAKSKGVPLICIYLVSPQDFEAHLTSPVRVDFILRNLAILKKTLSELDIPLYVETVEKRKQLPARLIELCKEWGTSHVYCNIEYEVDELRREATLTGTCLEQGISFNAVHDTCVVDPGEIQSGSGGQMAVYTPWWRKWCAYINSNPSKCLDAYASPTKNPSEARKKYSSLFDTTIPTAPKSKSLTAEEKKRFETMWPAGEDEAMDRLKKFISTRVSRYHDARNPPAGNGTSVLSPHLAAGTICARTCVRLAREAAPRKTLSDDRRQGHSMWIGEVAWRDFYKHVLCNWPYVW